MTDKSKDDSRLRDGWVHHFADGFDSYLNRGEQLYTFVFVSEATDHRLVITVPKQAVDEFVEDYVEQREKDEN